MIEVLREHLKKNQHHDLCHDHNLNLILFKGLLAFLSIKLPFLILFKSFVATAICPLRTLVKIFLILFEGFVKQTVLVTSVVPYLY